MSDNAKSPRVQPAGGSPSAVGGQTGPTGLLAWLPWAGAAGFALLAGFLSEAYFAARTEVLGLREQYALTAIEAKSLQQRLEAERILSARRTADLSAGPRDQDGLVQCDFIPLHAPAAASPAAEALVVWNPHRQEGILFSHNLPAPAADSSYHLWIMDPRYPAALHAGEFTVEATRDDIRLPFKPERAVDASARFFVTVGRHGAGPTAEGPVVLTSQ
jgi:hypothetical protein